MKLQFAFACVCCSVMTFTEAGIIMRGIESVLGFVKKPSMPSGLNPSSGEIPKLQAMVLPLIPPAVPILPPMIPMPFKNFRGFQGLKRLRGLFKRKEKDTEMKNEPVQKETPSKMEFREIISGEIVNKGDEKPPLDSFRDLLGRVEDLAKMAGMTLPFKMTMPRRPTTRETKRPETKGPRIPAFKHYPSNSRKKKKRGTHYVPTMPRRTKPGPSWPPFHRIPTADLSLPPDKQFNIY